MYKKIIFIFFIVIIFCIPVITKDHFKKKIITEKKEIQITKYNNVVGEINLNNNKIKITKTDNNEYYLNHNYKDEEDILGTPFIDYRNTLNDKLLLIYGHNSKDLNPPFKELEKYLNYDYYKKHTKLKININNQKNTYKIFSIYITEEGDYTHTKIKFKNNNEYLEHLNYLENKSIFKINEKLNQKDSVIILQTCNYNPMNTYILVILKKEQK